jgi:GDP-L-fucose synthase
MQKLSKIFVAGHRGLAGSAIVRQLKDLGYTNIITATRSELDLMNANAVDLFLQRHRPEYVFLAAAKVGGILSNDTHSAEFIYQNLQIQNNVIHYAHKNNVKKLLFLGSNCIYPKNCPQPIKEEYLFTGPLEQTNDAYAVAKIAGIKMCQAYNKQYGFNAISVMPTNLYGPNDNFNLDHGHVFAALIRKFADAAGTNAPFVTLFGDGSPMREFLHADDLADACVFLMNNYDDAEPINVGPFDEYSIKNVAEMVKDAAGYTGEVIWDTSKPNGTMRKKLDVSKINALGWSSKIGLQEGIEKALHWYKHTKIED